MCRTIFTCNKGQLNGHRFVYETIGHYAGADGHVAMVVFYNGTTKTAGIGAVLYEHDGMPSSDDIIKLYREHTFSPLESKEAVELLREALGTSSQEPALRYAQSNLKDICTDVVDWREKGLLAPNSAIGRLRKLCSEYIGEDDALLEAERLVSLEAMKYVIKN